MTRRLPWKTAGAAGQDSSPALVKQQRDDSPRTTVVAKREGPHAASPSVQSRISSASRKRAISDRDFTRSPSTSPPPEAPKEEFMISGPAHDDRYRMVEDEFLAVARRFTTHLHRAEYARLRTLAASQNAAAIRDIERPVVAGSRPSVDARRRGEARNREVKQKSVAGEAREETMTGLRGLLESPRKDRRSIGRNLMRDGTRTRAGAGFGERISRGEGHRGTEQSMETAEEETSDELELPPLRLTPPSRRPESSSSRAEPNTRTSNSKPRNTTKSNARQETAPVVEIVDDDDDDDDDDPFGVARRKARREKSREQLRRQATAAEPERDTMPSFL